MIVEHSDLLRDLQYWETLSVSSLMLRPIKVIHNEDWFAQNSEMQEAFH
jgi:Phosphatidate cytidylyltransferase, mitochondrial